MLDDVIDSYLAHGGTLPEGWEYRIFEQHLEAAIRWPLEHWMGDDNPTTVWWPRSCTRWAEIAVFMVDSPRPHWDKVWQALRG
jgi:hypothetical protein